VSLKLQASGCKQDLAKFQPFYKKSWLEACRLTLAAQKTPNFAL
jgi:hypothetical protein